MEKRKLVIPNDIKAAFKEVGVKKGQGNYGTYIAEQSGICMWRRTVGY